MDPAVEQQDFSPPRPRRVILRGLPVAIVAHVLFVLALAWTLDWKRQPDPSMAAIPLPPPAAAPADPTRAMGAPPPAQAEPEAAQPGRQEAPRGTR
ncbi:hypothetical protein [Ramlibacter sp.]|uniref:hypothetical protein n=1 Tax=Ramlibacter sp. TaxID=1917967 RepID=UPI002FC6D875